CDPCGGSATYYETITVFNSTEKRTISTTGCPNHYSYCTGKAGQEECGGIGNEGSASQAREQGVITEIPARPIFSESTTDTTCVLGNLGVALNGVGVYGGAVDSSCDLVDVDDSRSEWTSFDMCSGHSGGDSYHYHFPPSCLLTQAALTLPYMSGHSPQVGWALDGFPIYGPYGPGGVMMTHSSQGCVGSVCLDECGGLKMSIPELDEFLYRYYMTGPLSDLESLPTNPKPASIDYPFVLKCYRGCTWDRIIAGACANSSLGVSSTYIPRALSGYSNRF
ncbi:unnamed protein product, partial [Ectocarpus fasciculatus]